MNVVICHTIKMFLTFSLEKGILINFVKFHNVKVDIAVSLSVPGQTPRLYVSYREYRLNLTLNEIEKCYYVFNMEVYISITVLEMLCYVNRTISGLL